MPSKRLPAKNSPMKPSGTRELPQDLKKLKSYKEAQSSQQFIFKKGGSRPGQKAAQMASAARRASSVQGGQSDYKLRSANSDALKNTPQNQTRASVRVKQAARASAESKALEKMAKKLEAQSRVEKNQALNKTIRAGRVKDKAALDNFKAGLKMDQIKKKAESARAFGEPAPKRPVATKPTVKSIKSADAARMSGGGRSMGGGGGAGGMGPGRGMSPKQRP